MLNFFSFRKVVNDPQIHFRILDDMYIPPSPISSTSSHAFRTIQTCVETIYKVPSGPSLMIGNTDTRWYWDLANDIYRFSPLRISVHDLTMFHGINERIGVNALAEIVIFYTLLIYMSGDESMPRRKAP